MRLKTKLLSLAAVLAIGAVAVTGYASVASASVPTPSKGNVTILSAAPRIVASPGSTLVAGVTKTFKIAGASFGGFAIPANATGAVLSVSSGNPSGAGDITVWTHGGGQPGTGQVAFSQGEEATSVVVVGFDSDGFFDVESTVNTHVNMAINSYVTPLDAPPAPVIKKIDAVNHPLAHIGPSVRTDNATPGSGVTDMGNVSLDAGTYEVTITGGFSGLKNNADIPAATTIYGGLFMTKGTGIPAGFGNVLGQSQGIPLPKTNSGSGTYTIDPTVSLTQVLVLTETTDVHIQMYGYSSDGVDRTALNVSANVQNAQFRKL